MKLQFLTVPTGNRVFQTGDLLLQPKTGKWEVAIKDKSNNFPFVPHYLFLTAKGDFQPEDIIYHPQYGLGYAWMSDRLLINYERENFFNRANDSVCLYPEFPNQVRILACNKSMLTLPKIPLELIQHFAQNEPKEVEVRIGVKSGPPEILEWK